MNSNSYFEIGSSHIICQDYALSGNFKDMHYGIVSDGCSSAEHSEIGAQILCHVAQYNLRLHYDLFLENVTQTTLRSLLGNNILQRANELRKIYPIGRDALQATLLIALVIQDKMWLFGWGDGYFILNSKNSLITCKIDYPQNNAPFYLCTDRDAYVNKFGEASIVRVTEIHENTQHCVELPFDTSFFLSSVVSSGDMVTIATDGLGQYLDHDRNPVLNMVPFILDYPSTNGAFVERTMNFLKRDLVKKGWMHTDDISVATVVV
jgi:serine/threonine protein phosphatase PrpC